MVLKETFETYSNHVNTKRGFPISGEKRRRRGIRTRVPRAFNTSAPKRHHTRRDVRASFAHRFSPEKVEDSYSLFNSEILRR